MLLDIHVFEHDGECFLFDVGRHRVEIVDRDLFDFLNSRRSGVDPEDVPQKHAKFVEGLSRYQEGEKAPDLERQLKGMGLFLTQACNMRCAYCYAGDGTYGVPEGERIMSRKTAFAAIDLLLDQSRETKCLRVGFFGGEPLLNVELMREVVAYGRTRAAERGKMMTFGVVTNGVLLNSPICQFLVEADIRVTLSLDGDRELNDATRFYGDSHYETVKENLRRYGAGLRPVVRVTVSRANVGHLERVADAMAELGLPIVYYEVVRTSLDPALELDAEHLEILYEQFERIYQRVVSDRGPRKRQLLLPYANNVANMIVPFFKRGYHHCSAGLYSVAVDAAGRIYPCQRMVGEHERVIGRVDVPFDWRGLEPFYESEATSNVPCKTCWARTLCGGGCVDEAIRRHGVPNKPDTKKCAVYRRDYELAMVYSRRASMLQLAWLLPKSLTTIRAASPWMLGENQWDLVASCEKFPLHWIS